MSKQKSKLVSKEHSGSPKRSSVQKNGQFQTGNLSKSPLNNQKILGLILVVLVFIFYLPALRNGYIWDDDAVTQNQLLKTASGLWKIWTEPSILPGSHYWPLVHTTFWMEYHLWGLSPLGFHLVNVLLHCLNTLLLFFILRRLSIPGSWLAAAIFGLHPIHVESVSWVVEQKDMLSGLFYFLSFYTYMQFDKSRNWSTYILTLVLFICALLSKSMTLSLPFALLLWKWWKDDLKIKDLPPLLLFIIIAIGFAAFNAIYYQQYHMEKSLTFLERFLIAGRAFWFYIGKLILPINQMAIYPLWEIHADNLWQYLYPLTAGAVLLILWIFRKQFGKGPLVAFLYFTITVGPVLGFVNTGFMDESYVTDHFLYLPCIGLMVLFAAILAQLIVRLELSNSHYPIIGMVVLLLILGILTWKHAQLFRDNETLFRDNLRRNPNAWVANLNYGMVLGNKGNYAEAIPYFAKVIQLHHGKDQNLIARVSLGTCLEKLGRLDEAIEQYTEAEKVYPENSDIHYILGFDYQKQNKPDMAIAQYKETLRLNPKYPMANFHLGDLLVQLGKWDEAISCYTTELQIRPDSAIVHAQLAYALQHQKKYDEAIAQYSVALHLNPNLDEARKNLDDLLSKQKFKINGIDFNRN